MLPFPKVQYIHGLFSLEDRKGFSTLREVLALLYALKAFLSTLTGQKVHVFTHNQNGERVQRKGFAVPARAQAPRHLFFLCKSKGVQLSTERIPTEFNNLADKSSK